jgi:ABC-type dipeptide/oligopeptide/nickel transport system permease component
LSRLFTAVPAILAGLIIIEGQFEFGGISTTFFEAVEDADIPLIVGVLLVIGVVGLVLRFILDVVAAWLDPRIRFGAST